MNGPTYLYTGPNEFADLGDEILQTIHRDTTEHFDLFSHILSTTVWQSPGELAKKLLSQNTPTAWEVLQDIKSESVSIRRKKQKVREYVFNTVETLMAAMSADKTLLQSVSTRLLVQKVLVSSLSTVDQDRIIAAELMLTYRTWKRLLSTIITHDILDDKRIMLHVPSTYIDNRGAEVQVLTVDTHIKAIESLPEIPIIHDYAVMGKRYGKILHMVPHAVSQILLDESVLERHESNIFGKGKAEASREIFFERMRGLSAYKKRSIGNKKPEPKREGQLNPYGA